MKGVRQSFSVTLLVTVLFGMGYFYYIAQAVCSIPISYSLGDIDPRFGLSEEEARILISEAESVWEDATGRNLFSYEEDGELVVRFIYDNRQKFVNAEGQLKEKLDATENISDAIKETYAELVAEYTDLKMTYATKVEKYEQKLQTYNAEVQKYNSQGGAPEDVYEKLEEVKRELDKERAELDALSATLNGLVAEINNIGERGNLIVDTYNEGVGVYNETFGEPREFTQGDYTKNAISIYTFEDREELKLVLVHELGHALSLDHVDNGESVMHYIIGGQQEEFSLTSEDLSEFNRVCGDNSLWERVQIAFSGG